MMRKQRAQHDLLHMRTQPAGRDRQHMVREYCVPLHVTSVENLWGQEGHVPVKVNIFTLARTNNKTIHCGVNKIHTLIHTVRTRGLFK